MKSLGIVRQVDELGRIVLPKELRTTFGIENPAALEIYTEEDKIILKKYQPGCTFCGSADNLTTYADKPLCSNCIKDLSDKFLNIEKE